MVNKRTLPDSGHVAFASDSFVNCAGKTKRTPTLDERGLRGVVNIVSLGCFVAIADAQTAQCALTAQRFVRNASMH